MDASGPKALPGAAPDGSAPDGSARLWHVLPNPDVLQALDTSIAAGLASDEARARFERHGPNELAERDRKSAWRSLWEQLSATLIVVLIAAAAISAALGSAPRRPWRSSSAWPCPSCACGAAGR